MPEGTVRQAIAATGTDAEPAPATALAATTATTGRTRRFRLFRSASVRFAAAYVALLTISAGAIALLLWWSTAGLLERQTEAAIRADAQGLLERWLSSGLNGLMLTIEARLAENIDDDAIYLLASPRYQYIAGNLQRWPPNVEAEGISYDVTLQRDGATTLAMVQRFDLPGGLHLLVGRDARERIKLKGMLANGFLWALLVVAVLMVAGAALVRMLFLRALASVSDTTAAISAGDLTRRVRRSGRGDEFDQLAETINDMLDRIARLMDGVRQVSNAIAHDLRTPITRARTRLEDALLHASGPAELQTAIERAIEDLDGIVAVFQGLLRIAEIEAGARRSAFTRFDLVPLLADLAETYAAVAEERQLSFTVAIPAHLMFRGDRDLVQQAIANLLDNALKFSPTGGEVRLAAEDNAGRIQLTVSDEGPGIPEAERLRATERFYRGETARNTPGSGLGLALVQAVANLHNGALLLEDAAPGLRATLALPAGEPPALPGA